MQRTVQRFLNEKFFNTVEPELLARFFARYAGVFEPVTLDERYDYENRMLLYPALERLNQPGAEQPLEDLHRISNIAKEPGFSAFRARAAAKGLEIVPATKRLSTLDKRSIILAAFLDHPDLFTESEDWLAVERHTAISEYDGEDSVPVELTPEAEAGFLKGIREFYSGRFREDYCRIRWFSEEGRISAVLSHGVLPTTTVVIDGSEEKPLTFREMKQAVLIYDIEKARLQIGARELEERGKLVALFAEHVLEDREFFRHPRARKLYDVDRIRREAHRFQLADYCYEVVDQRVVEIEIQESDEGGYKLRVKDPNNAIKRLLNLTRSPDFGAWEILSVSLRLKLLIDGKVRAKTVRIKPPAAASFNRATGEATVLAYLQRNGFCHERELLAAAR